MFTQDNHMLRQAAEDNRTTWPRQTRPVSPKAAELLGDRTAGNLPVWVRAPRTGEVEHYTGFSRAKLYELATEGKIRSVSIREPGAIKGTRLFHLASILAFIEACEQAAACGAAEN
jgi:hypothetical protein